MTASYRRIDYRLRPSKHAERRMLSEAFRRLRFAVLSSYQYVGMPSVYFAEFELFHRELGFRKMVAIEEASHDEARFKFNQPYACIEFLWGKTGAQLPNVDWTLRSVVWLDYDEALDLDKLEDISFVVAKLQSGSVIVVSAAAKPAVYDENAPRATVTELAERLPAGAISPDMDDTSLTGWGTGNLFRRLIADRIAQAVKLRNASRPGVAEVAYEQLFNFRYEDGVKMITIGGVIFDEAQRAMFEAGSFSELPFIRRSDQPFEIERPLLTRSEVKLIEKSLPAQDPENLTCPPAPQSEIRKFLKIYRHFPRYEVLE